MKNKKHKALEAQIEELKSMIQRLLDIQYPYTSVPYTVPYQPFISPYTVTSAPNSTVYQSPQCEGGFSTQSQGGQNV